MEIKKGQIISDQLAEILRERTSKKDREKVAKKHKVHVNTINNLIFNKRQPLPEGNKSKKSEKKADKYVKMMFDLCQVAFRNNDEIIKRSHWLKDIFKNLLN